MLLGTCKSTGDVTKLAKHELLGLASRCYGMALKADSQSASLWHDLGLTYLRQQEIINSTNKMAAAEKQVLAKKALQCVERAVQLERDNATYWNTLGLVALADGQFCPLFRGHTVHVKISREVVTAEIFLPFWCKTVTCMPYVGKSHTFLCL